MEVCLTINWMFINLATYAIYVATYFTLPYCIAGLLIARANRRKHSSQHHSGTVGNGLAGGGRVRNNVLHQTAGSLSVFPTSPFCFPSFRLFCGDVVFLFFPFFFLSLLFFMDRRIPLRWLCARHTRRIAYRRPIHLCLGARWPM